MQSSIELAGSQAAPGADIAVAVPSGGAAAAPKAAALRAIEMVAEAIVVLALLAELALVLANVFARVYFRHSFLWSDEAARLSLSILAFIGGAVAYRRSDHAFVRIVLNLFAPAGRGTPAWSSPTSSCCSSSASPALRPAEFIASSWGELTPVLQLPAALIALPLPARHGADRASRAGKSVSQGPAHRVRRRRRRLLRCWRCAAVTRDSWLPYLGGDAAIITALVLFFVAIFAGVPVGFVLLLATATYLWAADAGSFVVLPQNMVNGTGNFILLAIPFFILAGLIMERGGISVRLVRFIQTLVGHWRGGLLQVTVASMYVVSGLSGSKPADVAAVGTVMRDQLRERHGADEGAAVLAAAAIMGETVPPSIAMLIVGSITSVSVGAMFIGGLIPAAVMAVCLMALIYVRARRAGMPPTPRAPLRTMAAGRARRDLAAA